MFVYFFTFLYLILILLFTFVISKKRTKIIEKVYPMDEMKDRIRQLMIAQHMNQQSFADILEISPASLSSIFNDRTKPTLNHIDAIKNKFPSINLDWLMYGKGQMYLDTPTTTSTSKDNSSKIVSPVLNFDDTNYSTPTLPPNQSQYSPISTSNAHQKQEQLTMNFFDKKERKITEIRIFYDDQTWETFVPKK